MDKVYILYENEDWMPPLEKELKALNIPFEKWHLAKGKLDLDQEPPKGVFLNRMSPSSHTRGNLQSVNYTREVLYWLESYGRRVINGFQAFAFEVSKVRQYTALKRCGLRVPHTVAVVGEKSDWLEAAKAMPTPFISKHNRGGKGLGVQLFQTYESFEQVVNADQLEASPDHVLLLQEYIKPKNGFITRAEFVNQKFIYAVNVSVEQGFELCPAEACEIGDQFCPTTDDQVEEETASRQSLFSLNEGFSDPIIKQYENFMKENQIEIAGIEFIESDFGEKITYDVNATTNYSPGVEENHGLSGMRAQAEFLKNELDSISEQ